MGGVFCLQSERGLLRNMGYDLFLIITSWRGNAEDVTPKQSALKGNCYNAIRCNIEWRMESLRSMRYHDLAREDIAGGTMLC
jgi:hypothetical protein